jgi:hypothetical protein
MILHLALFRWRESVTDDDVAALTAALEEMAAGNPAIRGYRCGPHLRLRPSPADFGVAALVDDEDGLAAYLDAPAHAAVYERHLSAMLLDRQAVQLSVPAGAAL